jgi:hypothetical protein
VRLAAAILTACIALPASSQAQSDSALSRALSSFRPGQLVQVALLRSRWSGEFRRVGGDTLFFGSRGDSAMAIRFNAIDTLWRRSSRSTRGTWIGGTTGALLSGYASIVWVGLAGEGGSSNDIGTREIRAGLLGVVAGATVGGLTGALIGSTFKRWRRVFP